MTESQIPKPVKAHSLIGKAAGIRGVRTEMAKVNGANAKIAVFLTNFVGSMWCAYLFAGIAFLVSVRHCGLEAKASLHGSLKPSSNSYCSL